MMTSSRGGKHSTGFMLLNDVLGCTRSRGVTYTRTKTVPFDEV